MRNRPPAVAGRFYPADPDRLRRAVRLLLDAADVPPTGRPEALIAPHAGYAFSGAVAATAFAALGPHREAIRRVALLGTAHSAVSGLASSRLDAFETPLGPVPVDREAVDAMADLPQISEDERAHGADHALEVQLPFLQEVLGPFAIVPLLVGRCEAVEVAEVIERLEEDDRTLVVVSSDLSHYLPYDEARARDRETAEAIEAIAPDRVGRRSACGHRAIGGLLLDARRRGLRAKTLDVRNSGDSGGPSDRVVGYGAFLFESADAVGDARSRPIGAGSA